MMRSSLIALPLLALIVLAGPASALPGSYTVYESPRCMFRTELQLVGQDTCLNSSPIVVKVPPEEAHLKPILQAADVAVWIVRKNAVSPVCDPIEGGLLLGGGLTGVAICPGAPYCHPRKLVQFVCMYPRPPRVHETWCEVYSPHIPTVAVPVPLVTAGGQPVVVRIDECLTEIAMGHNLAWKNCEADDVVHYDCEWQGSRCMLFTSALHCLNPGNPCDGLDAAGRRMVLWSFCYTIRRNLLQNAGFEYDTHSWTTTCGSATGLEPGSTSNDVLYLTGAAGCAVSQTVGVDSRPSAAGTQPTWRYSAMIHTLQVANEMSLEWLDSQGQVIGWKSIAGEWSGESAVADEVPIPLGATQARFSVRLIESGTIRVDDANLAPKLPV